jgi:hypothetical protein
VKQIGGSGLADHRGLVLAWRVYRSRRKHDGGREAERQHRRAHSDNEPHTLNC